jgi:Double zinc ribbon
MASSLTNYRDVGKGGNADMNVGFQFEFTCGNCLRTWKSPFRPYRRGQLAGLVYKFAYYLGDRGGMFRGLDLVANTGETRARQSALDDALRLAEQRYTDCPGCHKSVCEDCWDDRARLCERCRGESGRSSSAGASRGSLAETGAEPRAERQAAAACSNCGSALDGGRFCPECGFDVASTHKSCPTCGTLCSRGARFCTDCGHGF